MWAETLDVAEDVTSIVISIHSARVGGDDNFSEAEYTYHDFNPLRPCGRRPHVNWHIIFAIKFQSTPPVWAETPQNNAKHMPYKISIHSARVGGDLHAVLREFSAIDFNPLRPCGRRHKDD